MNRHHNGRHQRNHPSILSRRARVVTVDVDSMTIALESSANCTGCNAGGGCGAGLFASLFNRGNGSNQAGQTLYLHTAAVQKGDVRPSPSLAVQRLPDCERGDQVELRLSSATALRMAFVVYCLPVLWMLLLASVSEYFFSAGHYLAAAWGMLGLLTGLVGGLIAYSRLSGCIEHGSVCTLQVNKIEPRSNEIAVYY